MNTISTHVLDTALGLPAEGIRVILQQSDGEAVGVGVTDADGRVRDLLDPDARLESGEYRLTFQVAAYFERTQRDSFYTEIGIDFKVGAGSTHYHVPLLLSPFGYSTYRGS